MKRLGSLEGVVAMGTSKHEHAENQARITGVMLGQQAPSIKLIRGQKGSYGFEIKIFGNDKSKLLKELRKVHDVLVSVYCDKNFKLLGDVENESG